MGNYIFVSRYNTIQARSDNINPIAVKYKDILKAVLVKQKEIQGVEIIYMDIFDIIKSSVIMSHLAVDRLLESQNKVIVFDLERLLDDDKSSSSESIGKRKDIMKYLLDKYLYFGGDNLILVGVQDEEWYCMEDVNEYMTKFNAYSHLFIDTQEMRNSL